MVRLSVLEKWMLTHRDFTFIYKGKILTFTETELPISEIKHLLRDNYVEIDSPDGFVEVTQFVDKGEWDEWVIEDFSGNIVSVNENHLFYTLSGWKYASDIENGDCILKDTGQYEPVKSRKTGKKIPIVDIQVNHKNHQYYANGFCSHNTNVGKSMMMCSMASDDIRQGKNVVTLPWHRWPPTTTSTAMPL